MGIVCLQLETLRNALFLSVKFEPECPSANQQVTCKNRGDQFTSLNYHLVVRDNFQIELV